MKNTHLVACAAVILCACGSLGKRLPESPGERASGFGYVPLDGLAIRESRDFTTCPYDTVRRRQAGTLRPLLQDLPDLSVRFAVASFSADGALTFGPAKITAAGGTYRAVLDYVNVDALPVDVFLRMMVKRGEQPAAPRKILSPVQQDEEIVSYEAQIQDPPYNAADSVAYQALVEQFEQVTIPVYVGIGMRLSADIRALKSGINLTSLGTIAAAAQANGLSGTLTVQTLGITGKAIATALPLPSRLDQTTVENGILALGSSRAIIYGAAGAPGDVTMTPRIVGLYSPVGSDPRLINAIYSALSREKPPFERTCTAEAAEPVIRASAPPTP
jgi:hypothetical protein